MPVRENGKLENIILVPVEKIPSRVKAGLPEEIEKELNKNYKVYGKNAIKH